MISHAFVLFAFATVGHVPGVSHRGAVGVSASGSVPGAVVVRDLAVRRDRVVDVESTLYRGGEPVSLPVIKRLEEVPFSVRSTSVIDSPYRFVAYDDGENVVSELRVGVPTVNIVGGGTVSGFMFLPASAVRIRLLYEDEVIAERVASPNPPTAKLLAPVGGERWRNDGTTSVGGKAAVRWEVRDPDGDELTAYANYVVNSTYSGTGIPGRDLDGRVVDPKTFEPSTSARILLNVSDGWYTGAILGPPFSVDPHPFERDSITLLEPEAGSFPLDRKSVRTFLTRFHARAMDPNTSSVIDDNYPDPGYPYRWYLNGKLVSKRQIFVTSKLACSPSPARVTITVKGSYNQVGKKTVAIPLTPKKPPRACKKRKRKRK